MNTILFKASGRSSSRPTVVLTSIDLTAQYSTPASVSVSRALSSVCRWVRCNCTPRRIWAAITGEYVSYAVAAIVIAAMWWHNISIDNVLEAQSAVATDCLCGMPWAIVWAYRATVADYKSMTKGGRK